VIKKTSDNKTSTPSSSSSKDITRINKQTQNARNVESSADKSRKVNKTRHQQQVATSQRNVGSKSATRTTDKTASQNKSTKTSNTQTANKTQSTTQSTSQANDNTDKQQSASLINANKPNNTVPPKLDSKQTTVKNDIEIEKPLQPNNNEKTEDNVLVTNTKTDTVLNSDVHDDNINKNKKKR